MQADQITLKLSPFKLMMNKNALTPIYSVLKLMPNRVTGSSAFATMEVNMEIGVSAECHVNTYAFLTVLDSLAKKEEVIFALKDGVLAWKCGTAKGKLALVALDMQMPKIGRKEKLDGAWKVDKFFGKALDLGSISCDNNALASVGLYGIVVDNTEKLSVYSSDNSSISYCEAGEFVVDEMPDKFTLSPEAAAVLASVCRRNDGHIIFTETDVFFFCDAIRLLIRYAPPMEKDLGKVARKYMSGKTIELPPGVVDAFIKRVNVLTDNQKDAEVILSIGDSRVSLSFASTTQSSDEYYMAKGLKGVADIEPVHLAAQKLSRALSGCTHMIAEHLANRTMVLVGKDPLFYYMLAARASTK